MTGSPVVTLNRAVAAAMADGPKAGLAVLDEMGDRLAAHHRLEAVRAHLLEMAGDTEGGARLLPRGGRTHDEPARAALPGPASGTAQGEGRPPDGRRPSAP